MKSPYLQDSRLADIVAAIQVMGIYPWASRKPEDWLKTIGEPLSAADWGAIFKAHPEIFRLTQGGWASLRWRHGYRRTFDPIVARSFTDSERGVLTALQRDDLTHKPLTPDQTQALMTTALNLHERAVAHAQERRWLARSFLLCWALCWRLQVQSLAHFYQTSDISRDTKAT